jgi:hypothetical protein
VNDYDVLGPLTQQRIGTYQHFRWLKGIISAVLVFNLFDASMTLYVVLTGQAIEANPLMEPLVKYPLLFVVVKTALVILGCMLLWRFRKRPFAVTSIFIAFLAYYGVTVYHLYSLQLRLLDRIFDLF